MFPQGGQREIVLGVDDQLLKKAETEGTSRRIPRDDVAALAVAALTSKSADNRCTFTSNRPLRLNAT